MKFTISPGKSQLRFHLDEEEKAEIARAESPEKKQELIQTWREHLLCNSELQIVFPENTGDLTDAPMFGIYGEETTEKSGPHGCRHIGFWDGKARYQPILERWAYTSYQILDPWEELAKNGEITLHNGENEITRTPTPEQQTMHQAFTAPNSTALLDLSPILDPETSKHTVSLHEENGNLIEDTSFESEQEATEFIDYLLWEANRSKA